MISTWRMRDFNKIVQHSIHLVAPSIFLREKFNNLVISENVYVHLSQRLRGIIRLGFLLWGYVGVHWVTSISHQLSMTISTKIIRVIGEIKANLCGKIEVVGLHFCRSPGAIIYT